MTSASPPHSAPRNWPMIAAGVLALAIVVLVVVAVVAFFVEGGLAAFGAWLYASAWGIFVRYLLESLALLVVVLIFTAILIYAERKIWGAIHLRRGPNVVGPWGTMQPLRGLSQVHPQGADHPGRRQQGRVRAGAAGVGDARLRRLGGDPGF